MPSEAFYRIQNQPGAAAVQYAQKAKAFDDSFYRDSEGNMAGFVNGQWTQNTPDPFHMRVGGYALWTDPATGQQVLRKPSATTPSNVGGHYDSYGIILRDGRNAIGFGSNSEGVVRLAARYGYVAGDNFDSRGQLNRAVFDDAPTAPSTSTPLAKQQRVTGSGVIQGAADKGSAASAAVNAPAPSAQRFEHVPTDNRTMTRLENFGVTADTYKAMPYEQKAATVNAALNAEQQAMLEGFNAANLRQQAPTYDASRK